MKEKLELSQHFFLKMSRGKFCIEPSRTSLDPLEVLFFVDFYAEVLLPSPAHPVCNLGPSIIPSKYLPPPKKNHLKIMCLLRYDSHSMRFTYLGGGGLVTKLCPTFVTPWTVAC